jgi:hypothetical protein
VLWTMRRSAMPSVPAVGARTRCTYLKRIHAAMAEDRLAGSRLTPDAIEGSNDGIAFSGSAFRHRRLSGQAAPDLYEQSLVADRTANSN